jgi:hypothetical protein
LLDAGDDTGARFVAEDNLLGGHGKPPMPNKLSEARAPALSGRNKEQRGCGSGRVPEGTLNWPDESGQLAFAAIPRLRKLVY